MNCISLKEQKGANKMRRGFTLIELMIVISVMAILMGIALPYFKGMQDEGNSAKAAGELRTLATAIESFNIHSSTGYPAQTSGGTPTFVWQTGSITTAIPTIVKIKLLDPFDALGTVEYGYGTSDPAKYYVIFSKGPDGIADITEIDAVGALSKLSDTSGVDDDIYISNGVAGTSF